MAGQQRKNEELGKREDQSAAQIQWSVIYDQVTIPNVRDGGHLR